MRFGWKLPIDCGLLDAGKTVGHAVPTRDPKPPCCRTLLRTESEACHIEQKLKLLKEGSGVVVVQSENVNINPSQLDYASSFCPVIPDYHIYRFPVIDDRLCQAGSLRKVPSQISLWSGHEVDNCSCPCSVGHCDIVGRRARETSITTKQCEDHWFSPQ